MRPSDLASARAMATEAAEVLPANSTVIITRSPVRPRRLPTASMMRRLAWCGMNRIHVVHGHVVAGDHFFADMAHGAHGVLVHFRAVHLYEEVLAHGLSQLEGPGEFAALDREQRPQGAVAAQQDILDDGLAGLGLLVGDEHRAPAPSPKSTQVARSSQLVRLVVTSEAQTRVVHPGCRLRRPMAASMA